jgi:hypothetical protein
MRSLARDDDEGERASRYDCAENLGAALIDELKAYNVNRT